MEVEIYRGSIEDLVPILMFWKDEAVCDFGLELSMPEHIKDLQGLVDSDTSDLLVLRDGEPIGYMGITAFKSPIGSELLANEHYWYIIPPKRGGMGAIRLLKAAQDWASNRGCKHLLMTASKQASLLHDNVCKLYTRLGFEHFETTFIKRI